MQRSGSRTELWLQVLHTRCLLIQLLVLELMYILNRLHVSCSPSPFLPTWIHTNMLKRDAQPAQAVLPRSGNVWVPESSCWPCHRTNLPPCLPQHSAIAVPARFFTTSLLLQKHLNLAIPGFISVCIEDIYCKKGWWWIICTFIHNKMSNVIKICRVCGRSYSTQENLC